LLRQTDLVELGLARRDARARWRVRESTARLRPMPAMTTSADAVHLLGGVAMTHILLLVAFPWVLSTALLTCEFSEVLLGSPTR
jgi:hypothetical protein